MKILFTICGRAGSKGYQNKNLKSLSDIPLLYHTLGAIELFRQRHAEHDIQVVVNTDSRDLLEKVELQHVIDVHRVDRKSELATDLVAKVKVIQDTYKQMSSLNGDKYDAVIDLDITSPIRRETDITKAISVYIDNPLYDVVFSACTARRNPYFNMIQERPGGMYTTVCKSEYTARQQAPPVYEMNASIYVYRPSFLDGSICQPITEYNCGIIVMDDYFILDIDSERDLRMMQAVYPFLLSEDSELDKVFSIAKLINESR